MRQHESPVVIFRNISADHAKIAEPGKVVRKRLFSTNNRHFSGSVWLVWDMVIYWEQFLPIEPHFYFTFQLTNCFYCNYLAKSKNKGFLERGVKRQFLTYSTTWRSSKDQDKDLHRYKSVALLTQFSWLLNSSWVQESQKKVQKMGIFGLFLTFWWLFVSQFLRTKNVFSCGQAHSCQVNYRS